MNFHDARITEADILRTLAERFPSFEWKIKYLLYEPMEDSMDCRITFRWPCPTKTESS